MSMKKGSLMFLTDRISFFWIGTVFPDDKSLLEMVTYIFERLQSSSCFSSRKLRLDLTTPRLMICLPVTWTKLTLGCILHDFTGGITLGKTAGLSSFHKFVLEDGKWRIFGSKGGLNSGRFLVYGFFVHGNTEGIASGLIRYRLVSQDQR